MAARSWRLRPDREAFAEEELEAVGHPATAGRPGDARAEAGLERSASTGRGDGAGSPLRDLLDGRGSPELSAEEIRRYGRHLTLPEVGRRGAAPAQGVAGAGGRRRRPRLAPGALPGRRRRRHPRAWSTSTRSTSRTSSARSSMAPRTWAGRSSTWRSSGCGRSTPTSRWCPTGSGSTPATPSSIIVRLRPGGRRLRQLPDPVSGQRRLRARGQAGRLRLDLPLRGPGGGLLGRRRAVLPVPVRRAAAARPGAVVRRGRRPGHPPRRDRRPPGERGGQAAAGADRRRRRSRGRAAGDLRRPAPALPGAAAAEEPGLPGLLRASRP